MTKKTMNDAERLFALLQLLLPHATVDLTPPSGKGRVWWIEAGYAKHLVSVEWCDGRFGIRTPSEDDYGTASSEEMSDVFSAATRVYSLLITGEQALPRVHMFLGERTDVPAPPHPRVRVKALTSVTAAAILPRAFVPLTAATAGNFGTWISAMGAFLRELRIRRERSQRELASHLESSQAHVSQTENRDDILVSTLHEYVVALGGELDIVARFPNEAVELHLVEPGKAAAG